MYFRSGTEPNYDTDSTVIHSTTSIDSDYYTLEYIKGKESEKRDFDKEEKERNKFIQKERLKYINKMQRKGIKVK